MTSSDPLTLSSEAWFCSTAFRRSSLLAIALLLSAFVAPASLAQGPMVWTDQLDYPPGSTALISGSGFHANETVTLQVTHVPGPSTGAGHLPWTVTTDASGHFSSSWFVDPDDSLGATFLLTATCEHGLYAEWTFTDSVSISVKGNGSCSGSDITSVCLGTTVCCKITGLGNGNFILVWTFVPTSTIKAIAFSTTNGNYQDSFLPDSNGAWSVAVWTNVGGSPGALLGTYNFTVKGCNPVPTITSISPISAPCGTLNVSVFGTNLTFATTLNFGAGVTVNSKTVVSATELSVNVTIPCGSCGVRSVSVTNPQGNSCISPFAACGGGTAMLPNAFTITCTTPPVITCPASATVECGSSTAPAATGTATATASCGTVASITHSDGAMSDLCGNTGVFTRTWTATDTCGNSASCNQTITVQDTTNPVVSCPAPLSLQCGSGNAATIAGWLASATASDTCGTATVTNNYSGLTPTCGNAGTATVTFTATDACGRTSTCQRTITVTDSAPPAFDNCTPGTTSLGCNPASIPGCDPGVTASDACGTASVGCTIVDSGPDCAKVRTITYTATDACGNTAACVRSYTWTIDASGTPPTFNNCSPGNTDLGCNPTAIPDCDRGVTATDTCGPATVVCTSSDSGTGCNHARTLTYVATDPCGNSATCLRTYTWIEDTTAPVITLAPPSALGCNPTAAQIDAAFGAASVSDNCSQNLVAQGTVGQESGTGCSFQTTKNWTVTDGCGNVGVQSQTVTYSRDTELPVITLVAAGTLPCNPTPAQIDAAFGAASVSDNCSQNLVAQGTVGQESGAGCSLQKTKNWTVTDGCGNLGVASQTVTYSRDTELPVITLVAAASLPCNPTAAQIDAAFGAASVSDNCSQNLVAQGVVGQESGTGCSFQTTKNWTVTDGCGNVGVQSQTVTYSRDTELPVITVAASDSLGCNPTESQIAEAFGDASVSDNCSTGLVASATISEEDGAGCTRTRTKNWTVTDGCGNLGVASQTVTYSRDTELPVITLAAAGALPCNPTPAQIEAAFGSASVTDDCSANLIAQGVVGQESGTGCSFQTTKNWTVTDGCGNVGVQSQAVTYTRDTELPVITLVAAGTLTCNPTPAQIEAAFGAASVSDNCSVNLIAQGVVGQESGSGCSFQTTKNWTVTDGCGNVGVQSQTVTYSRDTELPVITLVAAGTLPCNPTAAQIEAAFGAASVSDNCSVNLIAQGTVGQESGAGCSFQTTKNWTVTDGCGNVGVQSQTVTYSRDTELPVITLVAAGALPCNPTAAQIEAAFGAASVSDNCSVNLIAQGIVGQESGAGCSFQTTKSWTVTDGCGNVGVQSQTVTYSRDTELPVITLVAAGALSCNPTPVQIEAAFGAASVSDNCSANLIAQGVVGQESGTGCSFQTTKNWTVTDGCGNVGVQSQTVTYSRDTELPVITLVAAGTLPCNPTPAQIEAAFGSASVSDNCSVNLIAQGIVGQESGTGCSFQTTKNWTVTDGCGNVGVQSQTVTYSRDTELPVITLVAAASLPCNPTPAQIDAAFGAASVSDNCSQNLIAQGIVGQESGAGCSFQTTKNWTVTDGCGNVGVQSQTVTLHAVTPSSRSSPSLRRPRSPCNPTAAQIDAAFGAASVSDNCSVNLIAQGTVGQESGAGCSFQTTKNWTVTDGCGNVGVQSQTVTYSRDTELPVITLVAAGALPCNPTAAADRCGVRRGFGLRQLQPEPHCPGHRSARRAAQAARSRPPRTGR